MLLRHKRIVAGALYVPGCLSFGFAASLAALALTSPTGTTIEAALMLLATSVVGTMMVGSPLHPRLRRLLPIWAIVLLAAVSAVATIPWVLLVTFSIRLGSAGNIPLLNTWSGQSALFLAWTSPAWFVSVGALLLAATQSIEPRARRTVFFACAGAGLILLALALLTLITHRS